MRHSKNNSADVKWLICGKALIQYQTIEKQLDESENWINEKWQTNGSYLISEIYDPEYQEIFTKIIDSWYKLFLI